MPTSQSPVPSARHAAHPAQEPQSLKTSNRSARPTLPSESKSKLLSDAQSGIVTHCVVEQQNPRRRR